MAGCLPTGPCSRADALATIRKLIAVLRGVPRTSPVLMVFLEDDNGKSIDEVQSLQSPRVGIFPTVSEAAVDALDAAAFTAKIPDLSVRALESTRIQAFARDAEIADLPSDGWLGDTHEVLAWARRVESALAAGSGFPWGLAALAAGGGYLYWRNR